MNPLSSYVTTPFPKNLKCPLGITYNTCIRALGDVSTLKFLLFDLLTIFNKTAISNFDQIHLGKKGMGVSCPPITFDSKKDTRTSKFKSSEPSLTFLRPLLP